MLKQALTGQILRANIRQIAKLPIIWGFDAIVELFGQ
tara:strand:+ start:273 stop:383 length:111 start_codon:yes stop_codon:yes gene_type:complete